MNKSVLLLLFILAITPSISAQYDPGTDKNFQINKYSEGIKVDGILDEDQWQTAQVIDDFVMSTPDFGAEGTFKTEVKMFYTDEAVYISAYLKDDEPSEILKEITKRDELGNTDFFGFLIDSYQDGINALGFYITPKQVQYDIKYSADADGGGYSPIMNGDKSWDAVWNAKAKIVEDGWIAEFEIPLAALRFPTKDIQSWNINFYRHFRRNREDLFWNPVNPEVFGLVNQSGTVHGIKEIKSPVRLQATPYLTTYVNRVKDGTEVQGGNSFGGGMDIRYGINDAFTLDMTLIPDFGEAISDNQVLNLSPFEVRFNENRQFFKEGIELFNKGNLFYSRRIGGSPLHYSTLKDKIAESDSIISNPVETQLLNATKVSGRNSNGLGIGVFNAVSGRSIAEVMDAEGVVREELTNPMTNYNVLVLDQNLRNNSSISLVNTNVMRAGGDYDANVTAGLFNLFTENSTYNLGGSYKLSQKYFADSTDLGHAGEIRFEKPTGNLIYEFSYAVESDTYDPNDLGFLYNNNSRNLFGRIMYREFNPNNEKLNSWRVMGSANYERVYNPNTFANLFYRTWGNVVTKNFNVFGWWVNGIAVEGYDYFEARTPGRVFRKPADIGTGPYISTDYRKRLSLDLEGGVRFFDGMDMLIADLNFGPRFRVNDKMFVRWNLGYTTFKNDRGYVDDYVDGNGEDQILFGIRDRQVLENSLNLRYSFTANMTLNLRMRHYWSVAAYNSFARLEEDGYLTEIDFNNDYDRSYTAFNVDAVFQWRFAPGSDIFIVWKNSIDAFETDQSRIPYGYGENFNSLQDYPIFNTLSFKLIYFLDYNQIVK
jgi:hypothetical protein